MNQNLNSNNFSKQINDEKLKSLFIPSSYYEKDIYDNNSNNIGSMPTQYYNFQPTQYLANDSKEKAKKIIHSTKNANPLNITNNINISNYSFNETQKQETNYQPHLNFEEQTNLRNDCQKKCRKKKKNIQNMNISQRQQLYSFHNPNSNFKNELNNVTENSQISNNSKNIKKFNRSQSIVYQNFGYLNDDEDNDDLDPNQNIKLHPQNFFKTKICPLNLTGNCINGNKCKFSHSNEELRRMPDLKKTKICQLYMMGRCHLGPNCSFAHGEEELRTNVDFYKTTICKAFKNGFCPKGQFCNYAHGEHDMRAPLFYDMETLFQLRKTPFPDIENQNQDITQNDQNKVENEEIKVKNQGNQTENQN